LKDVKKMTIHRLIVTVTIVETTTITMTQLGERTDEATMDFVDRSVVGHIRRREVRRRAQFTRGDVPDRAAARDDDPAGRCDAG
jgi:hypothetical protein